MTATSLIRLGTTALFLPTGVTGGPTARVGFVSTAPTPPANLTLDQALAGPGAFVMFPGLPADAGSVQGFAAAARVFLMGSGRRDVRFVWVDSGTPGAGGLSGFVLAASGQAGGAVVTNTLTKISLGNIVLSITGGNTVSVAGGGDGLLFTPASGAPNLLSGAAFASRARSDLPASGPLTLDLADGSITAGCFVANVTFDTAAMENFDVGIRYFIPAGFVPYLDTAGFRLFDLEAPKPALTLAMAATLDPLAPTDPERSNRAPSSNAGPLPATFLNPVGQRLTLTPEASGGNPGRLGLVPRKAVVPPPNPNVAPSLLGPVYYLSPFGDFAVDLWSGAGAAGGTSKALMPGKSGGEYFQFDPVQTVLGFQLGQPAFAPLLPTGSDIGPLTFDTMDDYSLTSYASIRGSQDIAYFAQPRSAVLHKTIAGATALAGASFLSYLPLRAGTITKPAAGATSPLMPVAAFAGFNPSRGMTAELVSALEDQVLAPTRRSRIPSPAATPGGTAETGVTPRGSVLSFTGDSWTSMILAQSADKQTLPLQLNGVTGALKRGFLSDPMFLVASDPTAFQASTSYPYVLTIEGLNALKARKAVPDAALAALRANKVVGTRYPDVSAFAAAATPSFTDPKNPYSEFAKVVEAEAADFSVTIAGWHFNLAPEVWSNHRTIMIFKFARQSIVDLAGATNAWFEPQTFNTNPKATQQALKTYIDDTLQRAGSDPHIEEYVEQILNNPDWMGILAINVDVPLSGLPEQLEGIAAGIDPHKFFADHVGIRVTPLKGDPTAISQYESDMFGLINYQEPSYLAGTAAYDFKVLSLKVAFANSQLIQFSSRIDLLVNQLFNAGVSVLSGVPSAGNNMIFNGTYQRDGSAGSYVFAADTPTVFRSNGAVVDRVLIESARFVTLTPTVQQQQEDQVHTRFVCTGTMSFDKLPVDLFSFGTDTAQPVTEVNGLEFSDLYIDMNFNSAIPNYKTFDFDISGMRFNTGASKTRPGGFVSHFPVKLTGIVEGSGSTTPAKMEYLPVNIAVSTSALSPPWFGLVFELNLGSLGALAAKAGFIAQVMLAWSSGGGRRQGSDYPVFLGLELPGVNAGQQAISLEGVLKLSFGEIDLSAHGDSYILEIRQIALKALSLTLPKTGETSLYIFGDPSNNSGKVVGWYGGYAKAGDGAKALQANGPGGATQ